MHSNFVTVTDCTRKRNITVHSADNMMISSEGFVELRDFCASAHAVSNPDPSHFRSAAAGYCITFKLCNLADLPHAGDAISEYIQVYVCMAMSYQLSIYIARTEWAG